MRLLISIAAVAFGLLSGHAAAEPPGWVYLGTLNQNFLWCQTKEDLQALVDARVQDSRDGTRLFDQYSNERLWKHERCNYGDVGMHNQGGDFVEYGVVPDYAGGYKKVYLYNIGNTDCSRWILWMEPLPDRAS